MTTPPATPLMMTSRIVGRCPIHGDQAEHVRVTLDIPEQGCYCLICYAMWLAENVTKLDPTGAK